ncbi:MAG TPA: hypothetical protein DCZ95_18110 [Verrucomicrobia bacterium]|nr:hypothetical protein [Verrucomicrobiota bacterium]
MGLCSKTSVSPVRESRGGWQKNKGEKMHQSFGYMARKVRIVLDDEQENAIQSFFPDDEEFKVWPFNGLAGASICQVMGPYFVGSYVSNRYFLEIYKVIERWEYMVCYQPYRHMWR